MNSSLPKFVRKSRILPHKSGEGGQPQAGRHSWAFGVMHVCVARSDDGQLDGGTLVLVMFVFYFEWESCYQRLST
jgi:hypothetical protein